MSQQTFFTFFLLLLSELLLFIDISSGVSCGSLTDQVSCEAEEVCAWFSTYCGCGSSLTQEIMFVMDESGSVGSSGWNLEVAFVTDMITTGIDETSKVAVVQFETSSYVIWDFDDDQTDRNNVLNAINAIVFNGGGTYIATALSTAIGVYQTTADQTGTIQRLLMLLTDGVPSDSPCSLKSSLDAENILVVIIGIGSGFSSTAVACLVDDTSKQIIHVDSFDQEDFDAVRQQTDQFLCGNETITTTVPTDAPTSEPTDAPTTETIVPTSSPTGAPTIQTDCPFDINDGEATDNGDPHTTTFDGFHYTYMGL